MFGDQRWIGLENFEYIFSMPNTLNVLRNTVVIAFAKIVLGLVVPITVALMLNELSQRRLKKRHSDNHLFSALHFMDHICHDHQLAVSLFPASSTAAQRAGNGFDLFPRGQPLFQGTII
ncbi:MAG: hypothetical protein ACLVJ6_04835 [Merdibacter sp.]